MDKLLYSRTWLNSPTGAQLNLYFALAKNPRAVIQINHGMSEHAARYEQFAVFLAGRGYHVYAHDHRGHGHTTAPDALQGMFSKRHGWQIVLEDVDAVNRYIRKEHPTLPVICFGHSMGSTIAMNYTLDHPGQVDGAAIWNGSIPGFGPAALALLLKIERMLKGSDVPSRWGDALTFESWNREFDPNVTGSDWLSRDSKEVKKYVADPQCGFPITLGAWLDLLGGIQRMADRKKLTELPRTLPFHILAGSADPCSSHGKAATILARRLKRAGLTDVTKTIFPDTRHESLHEINRDEIMSNFADWLDERWS